MKKTKFVKNGFVLRGVACPNESCNEKIIHPIDEQEYNKFINLRNKEFKVKMRLVGNSYAVSIPKEIVSFMNEQEKIMNDMVKLCFEDFGKLSLSFGDYVDGDSRVIKSRECKVIKSNKPVLHTKQFYDSANPENNRKMIIKEDGGDE
ncbi:MAG TPA: hypothetical protein PK255_02200 [Candidatus Pacearchaeota archaeon]|nr:hypothetical protein [Candidatus Pacearchaeota archaeon]HQF82796.1 hypothetical protein [Candidatus Pacearchaeota archaeon]HQI57613.1 hypothetical protein [Candidatus Pacearchaeota archaeon]HQJ57873.1 hypothetical protein [Candidatus Pacearchaeota archaeon]